MPVRGRWTLLLLVFLAPVDATRADEFRDADRELNAAYQNALHSLPGERQEQMRRAERAWITFSDRNEAAFKTFASRRGAGEDEVTAFTLAAIRDQRDVLRGFGQIPNIGRDAARARLEAADAEMTVVYKEAIRGANVLEEKRLREAQRAWITWRDENARALYSGNPQGETLLGSLRLTVNRTQELRRFLPGTSAPSSPVVHRGPVTVDPMPAPMSPPRVSPAPRPSASPSSLTPAAAALEPAPASEPAANVAPESGDRESEDLDGEAAGLLRRVLEEPVFGAIAAEASEFGAVPVLPRELDDAAEAGLRRADALAGRRRGGTSGNGGTTAAAALGRARGVFRALVAYGDAASNCRGANAPAAARAVRAVLDATPEPPPGSGGGPVWAGLRALRDRCERGEREAAGHLTRAAGLDALNRPEEAAREYEAAQRVYPDPAVAAKLRRLREGK